MDTTKLMKYFLCELTEAEEAQVQRWLAEDEDGSRLEEYKRARIMFEGLVLHSDRSAAAETVKRSQRRKISSWIMKAAAAIVIVFGAVGLGRYSSLNKLSSEFETISVPAGKSMQMTLADGTKMWMNAATEVETPVIFSRKDRCIRINGGEVYLEVAKDEDKPFIINTFAGDIKVLGTKFNVEVNPEKGKFTTSLLEGSVEISGRNSDERYILKPNEALSVSDGVWSVGKMKSTGNVNSWIDGIIEFSEIPFEEVIERFEKAFNVEIIIEREVMPELSLSRGKIRVSEGIDHALRILANAADFKYERDNITNTIYIR